MVKNVLLLVLALTLTAGVVIGAGTVNATYQPAVMKADGDCHSSAKVTVETDMNKTDGCHPEGDAVQDAQKQTATDKKSSGCGGCPGQSAHKGSI